MSQLFSPLSLRSLTLKNRIVVSPMCQYSATDGVPGPWHLVHLGSRAVGGAALVITEAAAVSPEGRISPDDAGIWTDAQADAFAPIVKFIQDQGAIAGIQLAHAGRKASTDAPWRGGTPLAESEGGWRPVAPSAVGFSPKHPEPHALSTEEIDTIVTEFTAAARRSIDAGFQVAELHMAHGYLLHQFLSPLSNRRDDDYGGSLENRMRFPLRVTEAVREVWPEQWPLFVRISASDWVKGGWDLEQSLVLAERLREAGVDLIDCSSGGMVPDAVIPAGPGFQTPFATAIRERTGVATGAVGFITEPVQAEQIVATGLADVVLLARELLRDPYWPLHAAQALGVTLPWPPQYERAMPRLRN
ncbi:MAG TPA: NADH:flavin oxidoreductase/NADH oxidase [Gammaproteobacteria bacterium]|nr:NADH:flavin oxidoreductase/NADH oxidase [Gammaproteobacteria bacterium]